MLLSLDDEQFQSFLRVFGLVALELARVEHRYADQFDPKVDLKFDFDNVEYFQANTDNDYLD